MFELFVGSEAVQRKVAGSLEPKRLPARKPERVRPRREAVRSTSAAALRSLAERLEPSPSR
jgi:hypothetical protein